MKIGIDISQLAFEGTGVEKYLGSLLVSLKKIDTKNEYILFFSSLRRKLPQKYAFLDGENFSIRNFKIPPVMLDFMWNKIHKFPIEQFLGDIDIFISSDWTEPPVRKAKKITILYDLVVYKHFEETDLKIVATQKRKLYWVKKEVSKIICISEATKKDAQDILGIEKNKLVVAYPGI